MIFPSTNSLGTKPKVLLELDQGIVPFTSYDPSIIFLTFLTKTSPGFFGFLKTT